ncbi:hypothetical protein BDK51DRAFT_47257 [Blyttiomyces helicus]|uniref:Uncharacterized protein n=1 Tax=Blyttiomyces helicus TaxID=388810 RepID=A0A4P9W5D0_9FUNG|nr:hypothetical protein BDK51DRAFT_47257 [Blyttiomyces helicus]|eukprot:RKO86108.1 hypothetical protein BDK51DRAFT_47257 [Blyttiomyces helicus]
MHSLLDHSEKCMELPSRHTATHPHKALPDTALEEPQVGIPASLILDRHEQFPMAKIGANNGKNNLRDAVFRYIPGSVSAGCQRLPPSSTKVSTEKEYSAAFIQKSSKADIVSMVDKPKRELIGLKNSLVDIPTAMEVVDVTLKFLQFLYIHLLMSEVIKMWSMEPQARASQAANLPRHLLPDPNNHTEGFNTIFKTYDFAPVKLRGLRVRVNLCMYAASP